MNQTTQQLYNEFAENYKARKQDTMIKLLECGKILVEAKNALGHGIWSEFLQDVRVSESQRTAQRMMAVYKNFRHLLSDEYVNKRDAISQLGVSHLLELQKLPDRFKKEIEVIHEKDNKKEKEIVKVIDEEQLSDFLEQQVDFEGGKKHIRDLPLSEMKKYIKEAQGIYEPEEYDYEPKLTEEIESNEDTNTEQPETPQDDKADEIKIKRHHVDKVLHNLGSYQSVSTQIVNDLQEIDLTYIAAITDKKAEELKNALKKALSISEGMMVRCNEAKDKL